MKRHIFLIPGFFGFANLGDFAYWGRVVSKLESLFDEAGMPAELYCVQSLPTASLRTRTRCLLETIAEAQPADGDAVHLIGHSTGGLDARLLLTPAVDLASDLDAERFASMVRSSVSVATPHHGAPIASFFTSLAGRKLLQLLSMLTMAALRGAQLPLSAWAQMASLFAFPRLAGSASNTLPAQLYRQLLADFNDERSAQVRELLSEVERDQSLLTQLTVETMDVFNAAAGDRAGVAYGSVITKAREPSLRSTLEIGLDPVEQVQQGLYITLRRLAAGYEFPVPTAECCDALSARLGALPDSSASDGIVPTLSQPWGQCVAVALADHLDIIGHFRDEHDPHHPYDWLATRSAFSSADFDRVWRNVVHFVAASER